MRTAWVIAGLISVAVRRVNSSTAFKPVELVDMKGTLHADSLASMVRDHCDTSSGPLSVVSAIGPAGCGRRSLLNQLFDAGYDETFNLKNAGDNPRCLLSVAPASPRIVVVDADSGLGGSSDRVVALNAALADVVIMNIWHADVGRRVPTNSAALTTLLSEHARNWAPEGGRQPSVLMVAVHDFDGSDASEASVTASLMEEVNSVWVKLDKPQGCPDTLEQAGVLDVRVHMLPHSSFEPEAYEAAVTSLKDILVAGRSPLLGASKSKGLSPDAAGSVWEDIEARYSAELPGSSDLEAAYAVDTAFTSMMGEAKAVVGGWRRTVDRSSTVGDFGKAATKLKATVLNTFDTRTAGYGLSASRRLSRRQELVDFLDISCTQLRAAQVQILAEAAEVKFSAKMLNLLGNTKDAEAVSDEAVEAELRKAEFKFGVAMAQLALPAVGVDETADVDRLSASLADLAAKFDESPPAKVLRLNKLTRKAQRSRKAQKNPRGILPGFHLSGMVRQIGTGSLQGFGSYNLGPHSVTMGYQNDRGTPESMASEDGEPFLRLQPKVQLDIDL